MSFRTKVPLGVSSLSIAILSGLLILLAESSVPLALATTGGSLDIANATTTHLNFTDAVGGSNSTSSGNFNYYGVTPSSTLFSFTGTTSSFTIPNGVTSITISVVGADGGLGISTTKRSRGGHAAGTLAVSSGQTYYFCVGGHGGDGVTTGTPAAFCGGGSTGASSNSGGGGGGMTWWSTSGSFNSSTVLLVAGGAGGSGGADGDTSTGSNGSGGGNVGVQGSDDSGVSGSGGGGGTQSSGGAGGTGTNNGANGIQETGGAGATNSNAGGGGGGGGYFGGGGGSGNTTHGGGSGGGGSGFASSTLTNITSSTTAVSVGAANNGSITLTYNIANSAAQSLTATTSFALAVGGHILFGDINGVSSTVSACGSNTFINGNDELGQIIVGPGSVTSCTITFAATYQRPPICFAQDTTNVLDLKSPTTSSTLAIAGLSSFGGDTINYWCAAK
jgi:hypothetical protein